MHGGHIRRAGGALRERRTVRALRDLLREHACPGARGK
nr:MAG: hypothetical protein [Molluscum contagiosum virus]